MYNAVFVARRFKVTGYIKKSCTDGGNPTIFFESPVTLRVDDFCGYS